MEVLLLEQTEDGQFEHLMIIPDISHRYIDHVKQGEPHRGGAAVGFWS
jgi:hypothetical protein